MINRTLRCLSLSFMLSIVFLSVPSAFAGAKVQATETQDFVVLYQFTGNKMKVIDAQGNKQKMTELSYKFVNRASKPKTLFGDSGWVAVRFQDKKGFDLVRDPIQFRDLEFEREYYGTLWMNKKKAKKISQVSVTSEKVDRIHEIQRLKQLRTKPIDEILQSRQVEPVKEKRTKKDQPEVAVEKQKSSKGGFWSSLNPFSSERKAKRAAKKEVKAQKKASEKAEKEAQKKLEEESKLSKKELKAQRKAQKKAEKLAKKEAKAQEKARKRAEKEAKARLKKERKAAEKAAKEKEKVIAQVAEDVEWEKSTEATDAEEALTEAVEEVVEEPAEEIVENDTVTLVAKEIAETQSYEDTEATTTLEPDENRLTEEDIAQSSEAYESSEPDNPEDAKIDGAVTNQEVALTLDVLEQQPPTIQSS